MKTLLVIPLIFSVVLSYDTGHHSDLTRNALEIHGYSTDAQTVAAVSNWFVDFYSYTPVGSSIEDLKSLHFDNLHHMVNISVYMTQLVRNTMNATRYAAQQNDTVTYLGLLGASLHAIQDFYTHSSWAEHHQTSCGCYREDTWFSDLSGANGNVTLLFDRLQEVRTYSWGDGCNEFERNCLPGQLPHGGYCEGLNKDSYVRPWFERSYGHSFAASVEWIYNFEQWTIQNGNAGLVTSAKNYSANENSDDLYKNYKSSIIVSYATKNPIDGEEDGHYKGAGSGSVKRLAASTTSFLGDDTIFKKKFTDEKIYVYLTYPNLYDIQNYNQNILNDTISAAIQYVTPFTSLPASLTQFSKIKVRTVSVRAERIGTPSPYAVVQIGDMVFYEAVMHDQEVFNPHWTTIKYVPISVTNVNIQYALWDDKFPTSDNLKKITDDEDGKLDLSYNVQSSVISGDVNGIYDSSSVPFIAKHDKNSVSIFIKTEQAGSCQLQGLPEPYCPDEAYTQLRVYSGCDIDVEMSSSSTMIISMILLMITLILI